jgi:hypothetical protein
VSLDLARWSSLGIGEIGFECARDLDAVVFAPVAKQFLEQRPIDRGPESTGQRVQVLLNTGGKAHGGILASRDLDDRSSGSATVSGNGFAPQKN